jgi:hypothetical protein
LNHFNASRLHDSLMLMLAYSRNVIQNVIPAKVAEMAYATEIQINH